MTRTEARLQHVANLLVGGTGAVYAWMCYFARPEDEFALANHPWQGDVQHLHVLTAPLLVFACGLIWRRHVWARVRSGFRERRVTGLALFASLFPMIVSGYGVQVSVSDEWRRVWVVVHVATSVIWLLGYGVHQLGARTDQEVVAPRSPVRAAEEPLEQAAEATHT